MFTEMYRMIDELHKATQAPVFMAIRYQAAVDSLQSSFEDFINSVGSVLSKGINKNDI